MQFKVFQIEVHDRQDEKLLTAVRDVMCFGNHKGHVSKALAAGMYRQVATVEANHLEHVFMLMNLWPEDAETRVTRLAPLHSLSVGDIVEDETGVKHSVESFGFEVVT